MYCLPCPRDVEISLSLQIKFFPPAGTFAGFYTPKAAGTQAYIRFQMPPIFPRAIRFDH